MGYQPQLIEKKWQDYWLKNQTFKAEIDHQKKKLYILDMFPYPSGSGLHVGHVEGYTATDIYSRFKRLKQFNVLHAIGWDAFGLPAENYAIKTGQHPRITTSQNIANFKRQIQSLGFSYDWDREISTSDPKYYKWTQWIFLKIFEKDLAYQAEALVNWCPNLKAVLSNEEIVDGLSEIGQHPVIRKPFRQWMLKITEYAKRLNLDLAELDWPRSIIEMQKNWIGRSEGINCQFKVLDSDINFSVYTTRADTLYGVTYVVFAPEHSLIKKLVLSKRKTDVDQFLFQVAQKSDRDRINDALDKTGIFTGSYALHPLTNQKIPIWIADYVLLSYGTGIVMGVPAHDSRDLQFASKYDLPIISVIDNEGKLQNSEDMNGLPSNEAIEKITASLISKKIGSKTVNYKIRDWVFSRQRYWGEPIPILLDDNYKSVALSKEELPLVLPEIDKFEPSDSGESPLFWAKDWINVKKDGQNYKRETNTMPQWAGSCWYYLRFLDPHNSQAMFSSEAEKYWMPVDLYIGGAEHAVLHLLYARFWHKVLYDYGYVSTKEPFTRLINQGTILGEDGIKMSKSRGNVVSPDDIIKNYGADTLRLFEMFLGPLEKSKPWQSGAIDGVFRFLNRVWNWLVDDKTGMLKDNVVDEAPKEYELKLIHPLIKKVEEDYESLKFNTAISAFMIFLKQASNWPRVSYDTVKKFILIFSPLAPHITEELWQKLGATKTLSYEPWPKYSNLWSERTTINMPIQFSGKTRGSLEIASGTSEKELLTLIKQVPQFAKYFEISKIKKVVFVPDRIINIIPE